jgi:hypothetical protein
MAQLADQIVALDHANRVQLKFDFSFLYHHHRWPPPFCRWTRGNCHASCVRGGVGGRFPFSLSEIPLRAVGVGTTNLWWALSLYSEIPLRAVGAGTTNLWWALRLRNLHRAVGVSATRVVPEAKCDKVTYPATSRACPKYGSKPNVEFKILWLREWL